jgi:hypothetical protein
MSAHRPADVAVGALRAHLNQLRWTAQTRLGWPALAALLLVLATAWLGARTVPAWQAETRALQAQLQQRLARQAPAPAPGGAGRPAANGPDAVALQWLQALPGVDQRGQAVARLLQQAGSAGVLIERADYSASDGGQGSLKLNVQLPLNGSYGQVRRAVAQVLDALPNAALDSLQLERADTKSEQLRATAQFTLYFRSATP